MRHVWEPLLRLVVVKIVDGINLPSFNNGLAGRNDGKFEFWRFWEFLWAENPCPTWAAQQTNRGFPADSATGHAALVDCMLCKHVFIVAGAPTCGVLGERGETQDTDQGDLSALDSYIGL